MDPWLDLLDLRRASLNARATPPWTSSKFQAAISCSMLPENLFVRLLARDRCGHSQGADEGRGEAHCGKHSQAARLTPKGRLKPSGFASPGDARRSKGHRHECPSWSISTDRFKM